jgi:hypothetical protein
MDNFFDGVITLLVFYGGAIAGLVIGALYFGNTTQSSGILLRLLSSAFGPSLALMLVSAAFWWPEQFRYIPRGIEAYLWLQLLPLALLAVCLAKYPGPRRLHYILAPAGLLAWVWAFAIGWLFVHGE